ncbi:FliC/FljB family flagellin [Alcaligenaceae bacterium B3P038]|nr:FliC/FljB family flagellin [Alcaligenaceae bacterium B3P038]
MPVINTNYLSLVAQNNLTKSQNTLGSAIEKLSSGLRINSAKDDAAGQAIANRFTANVKGLTQAARNANDGISIAQTTEGALNEINNNLQRVRELTVQATNGTNSATDLDSIQAEIDQRMAEINRVSEQTQFNGTKVLSSSAGEMKIQVGANDSETISINLQEISAKTLGLGGFSVSSGAPKLSEKVTSLGDGAAAPVAPDMSDVATKIGTALGKTVDASELTLHNVQDANGAATGAYAVKHGNDVYAVDVAAGVVTAVTNDLGITDGDLTGTSTGALVKYGSEGGTAAAFVEFNGKKYDASLTTGDTTTIDTASDANVFVGSATANPLEALDKALAKVDSLRSDLGAVQNRFQSTVANLNNTVNNLSAARSRIEDADYATEVSNMSKAQILQQAGTSVLAQANQVPQSVLSLLQ